MHRGPALLPPPMGDGIGDVGGVPEHDRGDDEVEPGGAELLRFCAAVGDPALLEGADDLHEGMTLFALVEPGVAAPAQFRAFKSVEHEQRAFDAPKERGVALLSLVERIDTNSDARRAGLPRVRGDRAFRAAPDRRADEGRHRGRPCARQAPGVSAPRCRQDRSRAQPGESRPVADRRRQATRVRTINRLSRGQPGRH
jgi:hypothetical protein